MPLSNDDFIRSVYRGVLGREPDPAGFAHHLASLDGQTSADAATAILRRFIDSEEFRASRPAIDPLDGVSPSGAPFVHAASLGSDCAASWTIKRMGLKRYSLPFDWIFSSLPMVTHCIEDSFQTFLDPLHYRPTDPVERPGPNVGVCEHAFYLREFGIRQMFNHFDPTDLGWHAYLVRAVHRFLRLLASPDRTLFLVLAKTTNADSIAGPFAALANALDRRTRNAHLDAIAILPPAAPHPEFGFTAVMQQGPHRLSVLQPFGPLIGLQFADPFDDLFLRRRILGHGLAPAPSI